MTRGPLYVHIDSAIERIIDLLNKVVFYAPTKRRNQNMFADKKIAPGEESIPCLCGHDMDDHHRCLDACLKCATLGDECVSYSPDFDAAREYADAEAVDRRIALDKESDRE